MSLENKRIEEEYQAVQKEIKEAEVNGQAFTGRVIIKAPKSTNIKWGENDRKYKTNRNHRFSPELEDPVLPYIKRTDLPPKDKPKSEVMENPRRIIPPKDTPVTGDIVYDMTKTSSGVFLYWDEYKQTLEFEPPKRDRHPDLGQTRRDRRSEDRRRGTYRNEEPERFRPRSNKRDSGMERKNPRRYEPKTESRGRPEYRKESNTERVPKTVSRKEEAKTDQRQKPRSHSPIEERQREDKAELVTEEERENVESEEQSYPEDWYEPPVFAYSYLASRNEPMDSEIGWFRAEELLFEEIIKPDVPIEEDAEEVLNNEVEVTEKKPDRIFGDVIGGFDDDSFDIRRFDYDNECDFTWTKGMESKSPEIVDSDDFELDFVPNNEDDVFDGLVFKSKY